MKNEITKIEVPNYCIPVGAKLVEAYETGHSIIVIFGNEPIPDTHNCDEMGCGSISHVKYILPLPL